MDTTDDSLVPLQNGCICCTLKMDLVAQLNDLCRTNRFDYIVIEASGICEPAPIAQTICSFTKLVPEYAPTNVPKLDCIVTVVDALRMQSEFACGDSLKKDNLEEDDLENLRYNNIIVATDADDDGMHIRMLVLTFFMKYYPDLIRRGHVHILQTPLFRVANKKVRRYCYSPEEKEAAVRELKTAVQITRFKGLGEISSDEFVDFIGENMRLDLVKLSDEESIADIMEFYMGDNTIDRQNFIRANLRSEEELEDVNI